jgi:bleomycin hydrolase
MQSVSPLTYGQFQADFLRDNVAREAQYKEALEKGPIEASKAKDQGEHHIFTKLVQPQVEASLQGESALCWIYAALSLLSINFIRDHNLPATFKFSAAYVTFYDKLEKANLFLHKIVQLKGANLKSDKMASLLKNPTDEGGEMCGFANIVNKYGLVPHSAMPHAFSMRTTKHLNRALHDNLRRCVKVLRAGEGNINEMLAKVYAILVANLGPPPIEFAWADQTLTPLQFAREYVKYNSDDYMELGNNPLEKYGTLFEADRWRNTIEGAAHRYVNVEMDYILKLIGQSLEKDSPLLIASDARNGKHDGDGIFDVSYAHAQPLYGEDRPITREDALRYNHIECFHMMVITGYTPQKRYQLLNTWSLDYGKQGYYSMSDDYARLNLYRIIIRTEFVSEEIKEIWRTAAPVLLGPKDLIL